MTVIQMKNVDRFMSKEYSHDMVQEISWEDFRDSGMLWWMNQQLHTFGLAIVVELDPVDDSVISTYPARVKFRGFSDELNSDGYIKVSEYMSKMHEQLVKESYLNQDETN